MLVTLLQCRVIEEPSFWPCCSLEKNGGPGSRLLFIILVHWIGKKNIWHVWLFLWWCSNNLMLYIIQQLLVKWWSILISIQLLSWMHPCFIIHLHSHHCALKTMILHYLNVLQMQSQDCWQYPATYLHHAILPNFPFSYCCCYYCDGISNRQVSI